jgi:hypothetical protein
MTPRTAGAQHVEDGVDDLDPGMLLVSSGEVGYRHNRLDETPLGSGQIGGVGRTARTLDAAVRQSSPTNPSDQRNHGSISHTSPI